MTVKCYEDLVVLCYRATAQFPRDELYGLRSQLQKAAVSIPSNIAEGQGRSGTKEFLYHLSVAHGSLCEVETQVKLAERLGYILPTTRDSILVTTREVGRLLNGLITALERKLAS